MFDALRILVSLEIYTRGRPHADNPSTTIDSNVLFFFFFFLPEDLPAMGYMHKT